MLLLDLVAGLPKKISVTTERDLEAGPTLCLRIRSRNSSNVRSSIGRSSRGTGDGVRGRTCRALRASSKCSQATQMILERMANLPLDRYLNLKVASGGQSAL